MGRKKRRDRSVNHGDMDHYSKSYDEFTDYNDDDLYELTSDLNTYEEDIEESSMFLHRYQSGEEVKIEVKDAELPEEKLQQIRNQISLLHKGLIVKVHEINKLAEHKDHVVIRVTLKSEVNKTPVFGEAKIRLAKQVIRQLKAELENFT